MYAIRSYYGAATPEKPVVLKYGELNPDGNLMTETAREFAKIVEEMSKGTLIIDVYPGSQLGDERVVITSYSIHYTKLYETRGEQRGTLVGVGFSRS